ncbi:MAG: tetratricopeptide repeat protein [Telluria sp.]
MPILGLGLHLVVAIFFAIHAVRTGRQLYWVLILFSFPLLGSLVYFGVIFLPYSRIQRRARLAGQALQKRLDPGRELREARQAFDLTPTAHNRMRLAGALLEAGQAAEAVAQYQACLQGQFAGDAEVSFGAARAQAANGNPGAALALLAPLQSQQPGYRPVEVGLALGRAHAAVGQHYDAGGQFSALVERYGSIEARVELALWALASRDQVVAQRELEEIAHARRHMAKHTLGLHQELFRRLDAAVGAR